MKDVSESEAAIIAAAAVTAHLESAPKPHATAAAASHRAATAAGSGKRGGPVKLLHVARGEFKEGVCGAKSTNIAKLHKIAATAGGLFAVPPSVTLPFGTCETLLALPANAAVAKAVKGHVQAAVKALEAAAAGTSGDAAKAAAATAIAGAAELEAARAELTDGLVTDKATEAALVEALATVGEKAEALPALWRGVKLVWASKWTDRAVLSRRAQGITDEQLSIAVLVQVGATCTCLCTYECIICV